jgi:hypothetical protein
METYPADIDPEQLVRWVMAERLAARASAVSVIARRSTDVREIPMRREVHLGDQEREDLSEIATVGSLEIAPIEPGKGWLLTVLIEDEAGPRAPDDNAAPEGEEEIDLDTFYDEFVRPGRGNAYVVAEVQDAAAKRRVTRLLNRIERNQHRPEHGVARR